MQQSTTAPSNFTNSLLLTVTNTTAPAAGNRVHVRQIIEGFNVADLGWGTAAAQPVTLSFWVRSSLTGLYGVGFINQPENRSYVGTYTISSANTWEFKTITVPGDTTGTWQTNNTDGIRLTFDLGSGTSYNASSAGTWVAQEACRTSSCVNWQQSSGATLNITGCQLEKGQTATSFDVLPFTTELMLCQRYYFQTILDSNGGTAPFSSVLRATLNTVSITQNFPVAMRTLPSVGFVAGSGVLIFGASNENRSLTGAPSTITGAANAPFNFVAFYQTATSVTGGTPYVAYIYPGAGYTYSSEL
jgi:hypothetical protein